MALSCPRPWRHTWFSISNITGLTLPGMMLEPGCTAGSRISPMPVRGPEASRRMSFAMRVISSVKSRIAEERRWMSVVDCICAARSAAGRMASSLRRGIGVVFAADGGRLGGLQMGAAALHSVDFFGADASVFVGHGVLGFHKERKLGERSEADGGGNGGVSAMTHVKV